MTEFSGLTPVWRASGPGKVAKLLIEGSHASPLIVIDEIEKASPINPAETPTNVLHSLLERENAARFVDEFVWSALPKQTEADRQRLHKVKPQIERALRHGLGTIGLHDNEINETMRALADSAGAS